jgi:hypothetical protein
MRPFTSTHSAAAGSIAVALMLAATQVHAAPTTELYGPVQPIPSSPPPIIQAAPATRITYVQDYSHLADLTAKDAAVQTQATTLARRQSASYVVGFGGQALAWALILSGATFLGGQTCYSDGYCMHDWNEPVMWSGVAVLGSSFVTAMILRPSRRDLLDLINEWNSRHADEPLTLSQQPAVWWRK